MPEPSAAETAPRTALVTGGGTGIGAAIADALARTGTRVFVTYRTHEPPPAVLARLNHETDPSAAAIRLDAGSENDVRAAVATLRERTPRIDVLVNNIGGLVRRSTIAEMDFALWREVMAVNLDSTFLVTHHVLPMLSGPHGRIINVSSLAGRSGGHAGATAYATAKAALFGFTRGLSRELAPDGITVNALAPGFIENTPFHDTFTTAESKRRTIDTIPVGRAGIPEDVAAAAVWLASEASAFVTGTITDINGGQFFG